METPPQRIRRSGSPWSKHYPQGKSRPCRKRVQPIPVTPVARPVPGSPSARKAEQEAAAKTGPKKKAAAKGGGQGVFDRADKLATVPQNTEGENILNLALPCLVHSLDEKQRSFENTNVVKAQVLQEFVQLFSAQSTAQKLDRAHKRYPES